MDKLKIIDPMKGRSVYSELYLSERERNTKHLHLAFK